MCIARFVPLVLLGVCTFTEALLVSRPRGPGRLVVSRPTSMSAASSTPVDGGSDSGVAYTVAALEAAATAAISPLGARPLGPEADVVVRSAGVKGMGAFAKAAIAKGDWLGNYQGELSTLEESLALYAGADNRTDYIMCMSRERGLYRDARNSSHWSRFVNHAERGNLELYVDEEQLVVDFVAISDVAAGEQLYFDYGISYWLYRPPPDGDSRNFSDPRYRQRPPELALLHPPPVGTVLPLTPLTALELQAALALPEEESRRALLRCLEYFGARRLERREAYSSLIREARGPEAFGVLRSELAAEAAAAERAAIAAKNAGRRAAAPSDVSEAEAAEAEEAWLELRVGVGRVRQTVSEASVTHAELQRVAVACISQALLVPLDPVVIAVAAAAVADGNGVKSVVVVDDADDATDGDGDDDDDDGVDVDDAYDAEYAEFLARRGRPAGDDDNDDADADYDEDEDEEDDEWDYYDEDDEDDEETAAIAASTPAGAFAAWLAGADAELALLRRWRERTPRFASVRHDAAAAAAYILWKNPQAHGVTSPLPREAVQGTCELLQAEEDEAGVGRALEALAFYAPAEEVRTFVETLARWFELGDGCTVIANNPPALRGAVPPQLARVYGRVQQRVKRACAVLALPPLAAPAGKHGFGPRLLPIDVRTLENSPSPLTPDSGMPCHVTSACASARQRAACHAASRQRVPAPPRMLAHCTFPTPQVDMLMEYGLLVYDDEGRGTAFPSGCLEFESPVAASGDAV